MGSTIRSVSVGDEIPVHRQEAGFAAWNRFAAVNDEFIPIHMDDEAGRAAGYDGAFGMGNLQWSLLHVALRDWVGDDGQIRKVSCSFRAPSLKGKAVEAGGRVTGVRDTEAGRVVELELWTRAGDAVLAPGSAEVVFRDRS